VTPRLAPADLQKRIEQERRLQGLPPHIEDAAALRKLAALVKNGGAA